MPSSGQVIPETVWFLEEGSAAAVLKLDFVSGSAEGLVKSQTAGSPPQLF